MATLFDLAVKGGPVMIPMAGLSIATVSCALERAWFWFRMLRGEEKVAQEVLDAARYSLDGARAIAERHQDTPIGRVLLAPLRLNQPNPETFNLAMEAAADKEFVLMRKGDKLLETIVAVAPLLGLLGTVTGLIKTFLNLNIGGGGSSEGVAKASEGIAEALIATASGMVVAIIALVAFRISVTLQSRQMDYFTEVGSELELIYRQVWYESALGDGSRSEQPVSSSFAGH
jgi:biopolymer transport protein ExbB